ncbi:MFS transporter [Rhodococcus sp. 06-462-5]|nr:MFS transporter [Rhodococcus sp. 06-462-5]OZE63488.1 MFS transporter [Rhodococcus sp. 02-925g]
MIFLWLVYAMNANTRQIFFFVLPSIVDEFSISPETAGVIAAIITAACSLLALPLGPWFDRGGHGWARKYRNAVVALGYFIFSIFTGIGALTSSLWSIVILQSVKNAFGGAGEAVEVTTMAESYPVERRGLALGLQHTGYPWGTLIASIVTSGILATFGPENWRYVFLLIPLAMIPIWIGYWLFATKKRYAKFESDTEAAGLTKPLSGSNFEETHRAEPGALARALRNPNIIFPSLASMLGIAVYTGISFWLPQYIAFVGNYSFAEAAAYSAVFTITGGIGQILWGTVSDWLGRKFTAIIAFVWLGVGIFLLQYAGLGLAWLIVLQLFAGMATNGVFPVIYSFVSDAAEKGAIGTANSVMMTATYVGGLSPLVLGVLIGAGGGFSSATGYDWGLYFLVAACVVAVVLLALFTREPIGKFRHLDRSLVSKASCNLGDAGETV